MKAHKPITVSVHGKIISIDKGVRTLILLLNKIPELETYNSCQGGSGELDAYVQFGGVGAFSLLASLAQRILIEDNSWKRKHRHVCRGCNRMSVYLEISGNGINLRWLPRDYHRVLRIVKTSQHVFKRGGTSARRA